MKARMRAVLFLWIVLAASGCNGAGIADHLRFAFFDAKGHYVLLPGKTAEEDLSRFEHVLFGNNTLLPATLSGYMDRHGFEELTQSKAGWGFAQGFVWRVDGAGTPRASNILVDQAFRSHYSRPVCQPLSEELSSGERKRVEDRRQRAVEKSWGLLESEDGVRLFLVLFQAQGKDMLASIAAVAQDRIVFRDYPATKHPTSVWRVDDEGRISPVQFKILYFGLSDNKFQLVFEFAGAEGRTVEASAEENGVFLPAASRYWRSTPQ